LPLSFARDEVQISDFNLKTKKIISAFLLASLYALHYATLRFLVSLAKLNIKTKLQ
jgi:hypothetical protein